jgi:hypothetical protein
MKSTAAARIPATINFPSGVSAFHFDPIRFISPPRRLLDLLQSPIKITDAFLDAAELIELKAAEPTAALRLLDLRSVANEGVPLPPQDIRVERTSISRQRVARIHGVEYRVPGCTDGHDRCNRRPELRNPAMPPIDAGLGLTGHGRTS